MNHDRLRLDLADLADEVTSVDLRDRALRTSRRLGIQRAVATSAAALVLLGAATGTALAVRPNGQAPAPAPAGPSITSSWPPVEVTPTPSPSPETSTAPDTEPSVLGGSRFYLAREFRSEAANAPTEEYAVIREIRGDLLMELASMKVGDDPCVRNSLTVSPDGRRVAWVRDGDSSGVGTLMTADVTGARERELAADINCYGSTPLVWQGGDLLMVGKRNGVSLLMDVKVGKPVEGDPGQERDRCWSADGRYLAAVTEEGDPYVAGPDVDRLYRYSPPQDQAVRYDGWSARSVSMDGRYVSIGWKGTDPSRQDGSFAVVDTTTSKVVELPVRGEITSIRFTADRQVLVRQPDKITVLDSRFDVVGEVAEPADVRELTLLAYVP